MNVEELVSDGLWELVEGPLPPEAPKPGGGRPRLDDRDVFSGIVYVLKTGVPWRMLPKEFGCSGVTWAKPFAGADCGTGRRRASGETC